VGHAGGDDAVARWEDEEKRGERADEGVQLTAAEVACDWRLAWCERDGRGSPACLCAGGTGVCAP